MPAGKLVNVTPAVAKAARQAPVTRPLPIHLESKHLDVAIPPIPQGKTLSYADLRLAKIQAALDEPLKKSEELTMPTTPQPEAEPMPEVTAPEIYLSELIDMRPSESREDEAITEVRSSHTCTGHCANHAKASDDQEASDYLQLKAAFDQLKEDYRLLKEGTVHLLTIADEHASTGDDLGCSPVWKTARRLAPVFGLEKTYA